MFSRTTLVLLLAVAGCGGYQPPTLGACGDGTPLDDAECSAEGFVAADRCFASLEAACECLVCDKDRCNAAETGPVQVSCGAQ